MTNIINVNKFSIKSAYRLEIDGLRAFAVIAVIINHFNKSILPGGYLGVDIFFVISGFVITSSLYQRPSKNLKDFISGFYERRLKRLVPALSVFVLISSITICLFNPSPSLSLKTGLNSLFGLSNIYLLNQSTDYFAPSTELNIFTHTWSLGVEEQFYILFPFLIWFSGFGRQTQNGARNLFLLVGALTIASYIGFLYLYPIDQSKAYFLMPTRFWEMATGCLIFIGFKKKKSIEEFLEKLPPLLLLTLIMMVMCLPMSLTVSSTAVVTLTALLIASLKKGTTAFKILTFPKIVYLGQISYSLYLWHWGVLAISRWTIGIHWWSAPFLIALIAALSVASYKWIETPVRKTNLFAKRWKTFIVGAGILFSVFGFLFALGRPLKGKIYLGKCKPYQYETCTPIDYPHKALTPFIKGTKIQQRECFKYKGSITNEIMELCTVLPAEKTLPTVFVAGSSYSHHFSPVFEELRNEFGIGISMIAAKACDLDPLLQDENIYRTCKVNNQNRISFIKNNAKEGDIIFTGISNPENFKSNSVKKIVEIARNNKINIVYFTSIPVWKRLKPEIDSICRNYFEDEWFRPMKNKNCSTYSEITRTAYETAKISEVLESLKIMEQSYPGFHVFPVHEFLCDSSKCPSHINGIRLYRDNTGHISINGATQFLSPKIRSFLIQRKLIQKKSKNKFIPSES